MRRTRRYWYEDCLWEITADGFLLLLALLWYAQSYTLRALVSERFTAWRPSSSSPWSTPWGCGSSSR